MNKHHSTLLQAIKDHQRTDADLQFFAKYHGTPRHCYGVSVPDKRQIAKIFLKKTSLAQFEFVDVLTSLYNGDSYEERSLTGYLLEFSPYRTKISLVQLEKWLDKLVGWAEVDTTCQSSFSADEILASWDDWKKFLLKLNHSKNINQRRASLVLLVKATNQSADLRLADLALQLIENVETERDILITKAVSWLLRSMTTQQPDSVAEYLIEHEALLPKIAIRETRAKLETGKKNHGRKK